MYVTDNFAYVNDSQQRSYSVAGLAVLAGATTCSAGPGAPLDQPACNVCPGTGKGRQRERGIDSRLVEELARLYCVALPDCRCPVRVSRRVTHRERNVSAYGMA